MWDWITGAASDAWKGISSAGSFIGEQTMAGIGGIGEGIQWAMSPATSGSGTNLTNLLGVGTKIAGFINTIENRGTPVSIPVSATPVSATKQQPVTYQAGTKYPNGTQVVNEGKTYSVQDNQLVPTIGGGAIPLPSGINWTVIAIIGAVIIIAGMFLLRRK